MRNAHSLGPRIAASPTVKGDSADLRVKARRAAALDQGRPQQERAVPGVVGDENEIGTKEVAGVEAAGVSPKKERDVGRQQDEDDQRRRSPTGEGKAWTRTDLRHSASVSM